MEPTSAGLIQELIALRKGRGINARQLGERIGPALRQVCGIQDGDNAADLRRKLVTTLQNIAVRLPDDLQYAVTVAFGIHQDARHVFYQERIRWLAEKIDRDDRTARRRVDDGIAHLAELATENEAADPTRPSEPARATAPFHIESFRAVLVLDLPTPQAFEQRAIVAERDGLRELDLAMTVPRHPDNPDGEHHLLIDVLHGGTLTGRNNQSPVRFGYHLRLPAPLRRAERHEYALRTSLPPGQQMRPRYVFVPRRRCDLFELRVRFDRSRLPSQVWRVNGAFHRDIDDEAPSEDVLLPDEAGEIHLRFTDLEPALGYGAQWRFD